MKLKYVINKQCPDIKQIITGNNTVNKIMKIINTMEK
jgi:hypothetical protein